jgi:hypothetical protein
LRDDRNRPKHLAVTGDVVAVAPGLEASVYHHAGLLPLIGDEVAGVVRAFYLVGGADVPLSASMRSPGSRK